MRRIIHFIWLYRPGVAKLCNLWQRCIRVLDLYFYTVIVEKMQNHSLLRPKYIIYVNLSLGIHVDLVLLHRSIDWFHILQYRTYCLFNTLISKTLCAHQIIFWACLNLQSSITCYLGLKCVYLICLYWYCTN